MLSCASIRRPCDRSNIPSPKPRMKLPSASNSISGIGPRWMTKILPLELNATPDVPRKFMPGRQLERFRDRDIGKWGSRHLHDTRLSHPVDEESTAVDCCIAKDSFACDVEPHANLSAAHRDGNHALPR